MINNLTDMIFTSKLESQPLTILLFW